MLISKLTNRIQRIYTNASDKLLPYQVSRWALTIALILFYFQRSYGMSYYIVTYLICFYVLQLAIGFWTPKGLQDTDEIDDIISFRQQTYQDNQQEQDIRPLASKLGQFQAWRKVTLAFLMGLVCTCFKLLQIDVFWPLLVVYFLMLSAYTVMKIIKQMRKHSYSWTDFYKK